VSSQRTHRVRRITIVTVCVIVLAVAGVLLLRRTAVPTHVSVRHRPAAAAIRPVVAVYPVTRRDLSRSTTLTAELRPYNVVNLYAKVSGYLRTISVDYGSRVSAGETIATLELPEQQAELDRTETAYRLAKLDYDRVRSVNHQTPGLLAQVDIDKMRAAYETARDERNRAQVFLDYTRIVAPFAGVVTKRNVDPGALVQEGTSGSAAVPLVEVADDYRLRLVIEAPESIVPDISVGTPVLVRIQATGETIDGSVARFSYDVHRDTRTMHTEIDVPNGNLRLKPGMYATANIALVTRHNTLVIPTQALANDGSSNIWIVDAQNRIRERAIDTGLQTPNWVEVTHGVQAGERVFIGDRGSVVLGTRVQPKRVAVADGT
jgi:RND family efflux transporter MFP subunit